MHRVVFSEGYNDLIFLSEIHQNLNRAEMFDKFDNENAETTQSKRLTQHRVGDSFDILYKAEGGRPNLISIYSSEAVNLADSPIETTLLVDLDGDPSREIIDCINSNLYEHYQGGVTVSLNSRINQGDLVFMNCELGSDQGLLGNIDIIAFNQSMEDSTGIFSNHTTADKMRRIRSYLNNNQQSVQEIERVLFS